MCETYSMRDSCISRHSTFSFFLCIWPGVCETCFYKFISFIELYFQIRVKFLLYIYIYNNDKTRMFESQLCCRASSRIAWISTRIKPVPWKSVDCSTLVPFDMYLVYIVSSWWRKMFQKRIMYFYSSNTFSELHFCMDLNWQLCFLQII